MGSVMICEEAKVVGVVAVVVLHTRLIMMV